MSLRRWAAATAAGILLVICMPVPAVANETDECADAGLISSLLGRCGLLGGLLGGSDPADSDPDAVETTVPGDDGPADTDDSDGMSGGPPDDTSGSTGPDGSGGTNGTPSGSSSSFTGTHPAAPSPPGISDSGTAGGGGAERAQSAGSVDPSQVVGPLSELPDVPQVVSPVEEFPEAAGTAQADGTGPVVGVALTLITAGIFVAITGWWMAIWRNAGRPEA